MVMGGCLRRFCLNMKGGWDVCCELCQGMTICSAECRFRVMYGEWYGVCDFVVFWLSRYVLSMVVYIYDIYI